ncbi:SRPBCC domain-containing protein [Lysobacter sp. Root983]|uniref:SRPBCC family protein n=1 Tax=Lysobacter sp. Root983 TaxID=1736613 RepID=UPI00070C798F|nr:SRPBCC domain-containing protein [Lysobacter sp. Root983]KRD78725.1 hypothetical protein ASE43_20040 [Lysobacter sp. Root983]
MSETSRQQVVADLTIAAPLETVWTALRDPTRIDAWFGWDAPTLADEIKFIFVDHASGDEANKVIRFGEWDGIAETIELATVAAGTRLRLLRAGGPALDWVNVYDDIAQGWVTFFQQLRLALERHSDQPRRTIFLSGPSQAGIGAASVELGLDRLSALSPGVAYSAALATGDHVSGQVWHRTHFQTAVTVDQWGDGLLVVTDKGPSPERPHGAGSVLLTTYGLPDAEFAGLQAHWTQWWNARYPKAAE